MLFQQKPKAATAGTNIIVIQVPEGAILKKVNAINETKAWQNISMALFEEESGTGRSLSLLHKVSQPGDRDVSWEGEMTIDGPFKFVGVHIYGCDAADALTMTVGYERAPVKKRGWGQ